MFMYPTETYFRDDRITVPTREDIAFLFDIIDARYRQQDYQVHWAAFKEEQSDAPDMDVVPAYVDIRDEDCVLVADVTTAELNEAEIYGDPDKILDQVVPVDDLVIGGFHLYDCVDRLASRAWERDLDPFVDEETTEGLFYTLAVDGTDAVPLVREDWRLEALGFDEEEWYIRERRKDKPWLPS